MIVLNQKRIKIHKFKCFKNKNNMKFKNLEAKCFDVKKFGSKKFYKNILEAKSLIKNEKKNK